MGHEYNYNKFHQWANSAAHIYMAHIYDVWKQLSICIFLYYFI